MPCAIARGKPNARAVRSLMWIGFTSPEMKPYRRPEPGRRAKAARLDRRPHRAAPPAAARPVVVLPAPARRAATREERAGLVPARLAADDVFGVQVEFLAALRIAMAFDPAADLGGLVGRQRLAHRDAVLHVHEAEQLHRKRFGAEHREMQRHGEDVWIGDRQRGAGARRRRCPSTTRGACGR